MPTTHTTTDRSDRDRDDLFHARIAQWLDALDADYNAKGVNHYDTHFEQQAPGGKYSRIVMVENGSARSVHAFLDVRTGDVYKAAGWKAPAKHVRFNLLDDESFERMLSVISWSGGYLYIR